MCYLLYSLYQNNSWLLRGGKHKTKALLKEAEKTGVIAPIRIKADQIPSDPSLTNLLMGPARLKMSSVTSGVWHRPPILTIQLR